MSRPLALIPALLLAGCASSFTAPPEYHHATGPVTVPVTFASREQVEALCRASDHDPRRDRSSAACVQRTEVGGVLLWQGMVVPWPWEVSADRWAYLLEHEAAHIEDKEAGKQGWPGDHPRKHVPPPAAGGE